MFRSVPFAVTALLVWFMHAPASAADLPAAYALSQGDTVQVSVWREDALQKEVRVLPDGSITFPLAGRVEVAGLSTLEVQQRLTEKLKQYLTDPIVTVVITGIEGNRVYVIGKVGKPGSLILSTPMTALQALSQAGGLDRFADGNAIQVLRMTSDGRQELLSVRYNDLIKGKDLGTNVQLKANDTVLVP